jgi:hypothetical protein
MTGTDSHCELVIVGFSIGEGTDPDPLPTDDQRHVLAELIVFALVMIGQLCRGDKALQAEDLADAFPNIPGQIYGWRQFSWDSF